MIVGHGCDILGISGKLNGWIYEGPLFKLFQDVKGYTCILSWLAYRWCDWPLCAIHIISRYIMSNHFFIVAS